MEVRLVWLGVLLRKRKSKLRPVTAGHHDFSEDTYRVLSAVDAAVMVIDAGKGIEAQTLKLFEVCRRRGVPIFVFINKMDRPSRPPLELLDELENVTG